MCVVVAVVVVVVVGGGGGGAAVVVVGVVVAMGVYVVVVAVVDAGDVVALLFGRRDRGERSKTGHGQGLLIDYPATRSMLRERLRNTAPGQRLFPITQHEYRRFWNATASDLGVAEIVGRPHNVRHTGPSYDVFIGYRDLRGVQRRGRWRVDASVLRYSKTHEYARALARAPAELTQRGRHLLQQLGQRSAVALS